MTEIITPRSLLGEKYKEKKATPRPVIVAASKKRKLPPNVTAVSNEDEKPKKVEATTETTSPEQVAAELAAQESAVETPQTETLDVTTYSNPETAEPPVRKKIRRRVLKNVENQ